MPTYEFRLPDGTIIERMFKISEVPDEIPNPTGDGTAVRIISGGAALLFKGSGFYLTDYGRNAHRTQGDAPKGSGTSESASEGGGKSESTKSESSKSESSKSESSKSEGAAPASKAEAKPVTAPKSESKPSGSGPAAP